jgi:hypothetical protein
MPKKLSAKKLDNFSSYLPKDTIYQRRETQVSVKNLIGMKSIREELISIEDSMRDSLSESYLEDLSYQSNVLNHRFQDDLKVKLKPPPVSAKP